MVRLVCSEFDEFADALRGVDGRYLLVQAASQPWRLRAVELGAVTLMHGDDAAGNFYQAACLPDVGALFVPLGSSHALTVNGVEQGQGTAAWLAPGADFSMHAHGPTRWLAMMINADGEDDPDRSAMSESRVGRASRASIARIIALARCVLRVDDETDAWHHDLACAFARRLRHAAYDVVRSMSAPDTTSRGRPRVSRTVVMKRALEMIDDHLDEPIHMDVLCARTGVSRRTLHSVFTEQLGMTPAQYLTRRLHGIHSALRNAAPSETVSDICGRFGVWDFGRFAQQYKSQFGRLPSDMLVAGRRRLSRRDG